LWPEDTEVITTPLTFISTNHAILNAGLKPVFCDIDESLNISPDSIRKRICEKTKAIVFVGIGGNGDNYEEVSGICKEYNLMLILDAAHMAGTKLGGKQVGLEADATIYSFQAVKNLPTADSGIVSFKDDDYDVEVRKRSWLGIDKDTFSRTQSDRQYKWYYEVEYLSGKYHGNAVMASLAHVALDYLESDNAYRRYLASLYDSMLEGISGVRTIKHGLKCKSDLQSSRHLYQISVGGALRDRTMMHLNSRGIFPGVQYRNNLDYKMYSADRDSCPNASLESSGIISLPLHLKLKESDIERICKAITDFLHSNE
jgi:dTDP-4-amino-4,6-dideoxygalactose transaminase